MRGCVMKRGKTYTVIVYLGRDPETGKKRRKWHGGYRTKKEAERACAELVRDLRSGSYVEPNPITVGEYLTKWLANHRQNLKPSTVPSYEIAVEKHLIPRIGAMPLQKLAPHHLDTMYGELRTNGHRQRPGGLSARSVRAIHGVMRRALNAAVKAGLLETNPALRATPPQAKSARTDARQSRRFLTLEETRRFLGSVREHGLRAAFQLSVTTGMRRGEVMRCAGATSTWTTDGCRSSRRCLHRATSSRSPGRRARTGGGRLTWTRARWRCFGRTASGRRRSGWRSVLATSVRRCCSPTRCSATRTARTCTRRYTAWRWRRRRRRRAWAR